MKTKKKSKSGGVRHHHITRVMYIAMIAFAITTGLVIGIYSNAQAAQLEARQSIIIQAPLAVSSPSALAFSQACPHQPMVIANSSGQPVVYCALPDPGFNSQYFYLAGPAPGF